MKEQFITSGDNYNAYFNFELELKKKKKCCKKYKKKGVHCKKCPINHA